ncbi:MAG TPA: 3-hydroxylacyl-ACP dehydratase [Gammaproteobacteria bacterium]
MKVFPPVAQLLPHAPPMIVIDAVMDAGDGWAESETTVAPAHPLFEARDEGLPGWALIELMAQTIAVFGGLDSRARNEPVRIGYLLGTRRLELHRSLCRSGTVLRVRAEREFDDPEGVSVYQCSVRDGEALIASARINVYQQQAGTQNGEYE